VFVYYFQVINHSNGNYLFEYIYGQVLFNKKEVEASLLISRKFTATLSFAYSFQLDSLSCCCFGFSVLYFMDFTKGMVPPS